MEFKVGSEYDRGSPEHGFASERYDCSSEINTGTSFFGDNHGSFVAFFFQTYFNVLRVDVRLFTQGKFKGDVSFLVCCQFEIGCFSVDNFRGADG